MTGSKGSREICILSQFWLPDVVGDSIRLRHLVAALRALGWKVTIITTKPHYPDGDSKGFTFRLSQVRWEDGVRVVRIAMPNLRYAGALNRMIMYGWFSLFASLYAPFLTRGPVIWAFSMKVFSTYAALPAKFLRSPKLISEVTDVWPQGLVNTGYVADNSASFSLVKRLATIAYRESDAVSTITPVMADIIASEFSVEKAKIFVNPYIANEAERQPPGARDSFTLAYFGNLGANYDVSLILKLAQRLKGDGVTVVIRGDGERLNEVQRTIEQGSLENVRLTTRVLTDEELQQLEASADAMILPMVTAKYEDASFPGKLVDYLFSGRPVVYVGGGLPASLVTEHEAGMSFSSPDVDEIAAFILALKADPRLKERMGNNARSLARRSFTAEGLEASVASLLQKVAPG